MSANRPTEPLTWVISGVLGVAVQVEEVIVGQVVACNARAGVLGVVHRVGHQLGDVLVRQPVEDVRALVDLVRTEGHGGIAALLRAHAVSTPERWLESRPRVTVDRCTDQEEPHAHDGPDH